MTDEYFMMQALKEAKIAFEDDEVPVGAVVVINEKIIARGHNMTERLNDPTAHAEMIALTSAFNSLGSKIGKIVYGADDEKNGYKKTAGSNWPFHPKTELIRGVMKDECAKLMKDFFKGKR